MGAVNKERGTRCQAGVGVLAVVAAAVVVVGSADSGPLSVLQYYSLSSDYMAFVGMQWTGVSFASPADPYCLRALRRP